MKKVIFGAQGTALGVYESLKEIYDDITIECFLVTVKGNNASFLGGLKVLELKEFLQCYSEAERGDMEILICTPEQFMDEIEASLDEAGLNNHVRITSAKFSELQRDAQLKKKDFIPLEAYRVGADKAELSVFKMMHQFDKVLKNRIEEAPFVSKLQVGTYYCDKLNVDYHDNEGDNISEKNKNYSELTGLYWMWKNKIALEKNDSAYFGLSHYRRFLTISDEDILRLGSNDIDAVLPFPMPYEPDINAHHDRYLSNEEWAAVRQALEELYPDYYARFDEIMGQSYMYNYNVIVARKGVLDEYCKWLFSVLFRVEEIVDSQGERQPNRYIGYVGETLETFYFMYNKDKLRIAHVGCRFLI